MKKGQHLLALFHLVDAVLRRSCVFLFASAAAGVSEAATATIKLETGGMILDGIRASARVTREEQTVIGVLKILLAGSAGPFHNSLLTGRD